MSKAWKDSWLKGKNLNSHHIMAVSINWANYYFEGLGDVVLPSGAAVHWWLRRPPIFPSQPFPTHPFLQHIPFSPHQEHFPSFRPQPRQQSFPSFLTSELESMSVPVSFHNLEIWSNILWYYLTLRVCHLTIDKWHSK